jgi:hypothetical protein
MPTRLDNARLIRAPRGSKLAAKSWQTEAPLRMLMNNLDPEVAEKPHELVVYEGEIMGEKRNAEASSLAASIEASHLTRTHGITRDQARRLIKKIGNNRTKLDEAASILKARSSLPASTT